MTPKWIKYYLFLVSTLSLFILAGCADIPWRISWPNYTVGPVSSAEFPELLRNAIPSSEGKVLIFGRGEWFPKSRGFSYYGAFITGVIAMTDTSVLFLQWYEPEARFALPTELMLRPYILSRAFLLRYEKEPGDLPLRFPYSEIVSVSLEEWGFNRLIVVQKKDLSFASFHFTVSIFIDREKTEAAFVFLRDRIKP